MVLWQNEQHNTPLSSIVRTSKPFRTIVCWWCRTSHRLFLTCCFCSYFFSAFSVFLWFDLSPDFCRSFFVLSFTFVVYCSMVLLLLVAFASTSATASRFLFSFLELVIEPFAYYTIHLECAELVHLIFHSIRTKMMKKKKRKMNSSAGKNSNEK